MQQHQVKRKTKRKKHRVVGRGGKHAKTSGRGTKGQKSRAGRKIRPEIRDRIKKLPKLRGRGKNSLKKFRKEFAPINLSILSNSFNNGEIVSVEALFQKGIIKSQNGRLPKVKILGSGEIDKKLELKGLFASKNARDKIEKSGGKII